MNYITTKVGDHKVWATIGTEGSWQTWGSLLLAGYALGRFEDSDRVRKRWIIPIPGYLDLWTIHNPETAYHSRLWLNRLIACNKDNQSWVDWDLQAIQRRRRPIRCAILQALFFLLNHRGIDETCLMRLTSKEAQAFATMHQAVLPCLSESPWFPKLLTINSRLQFITGEPNIEVILT